MTKQNVATTIVLLLCAMLFAVVGSSFMTYRYQKTKIVVTDPKVVASEHVLVYKKDDEQKTMLTKLVFSNSELGLKPVTGDQNADTKIPSTVTNKNGSEGLYATFVVDSDIEFDIVVKNIKVESTRNAEKVQAERENLFVAIMDKEDGAKALNESSVVLAHETAAEGKEFVLLFWLDAKASEELQGAKISFEVHFET